MIPQCNLWEAEAQVLPGAVGDADREGHRLRRQELVLVLGELDGDLRRDRRQGHCQEN